MHSNINLLSQPLVDALVADEGVLGLIVSHHETGAVIVDAKLGNIESGRRIAEICMGGLGVVGLSAATSAQTQNFDVKYVVKSSAKNAVLSCLGSQYAGWALQHEKFFSLGSGPARVLAQREDLLKKLPVIPKSKLKILLLYLHRRRVLRVRRK
jgi:methenyltetrahydromethanopterin cyclohydrolase